MGLLGVARAVARSALPGQAAVAVVALPVVEPYVERCPVWMFLPPQACQQSLQLGAALVQPPPMR